MQDLSLYIHVPFCDHKCIYCDFYSIINHKGVNSYLSSLKKEMNYYKNVLNKSLIKTIFFGGGTPSLLEPSFIKEIIDEIRKYSNIDANAEITLETNPGTVNKEKLCGFKEAGVNRISIGIQSFDEEDLKFLTRIHNKEEAKQTVHHAKEAGFNNVNVDLIFNLPGQTKDKWLKNLEEAIALPVNHISAYSLILEKGTILNKLVLDGKVDMQDDDYDAGLYEETLDFFERHGFKQYEVSNFAKDGTECLHNLAYWQYKNYLGLGPSAHSFYENKRWWNYSSLTLYSNQIEKTGNAEAGSENLNEEQVLEEYVMLALRSKGLDLKEFEKKFNFNYYYKYVNQIEELISKGFLLNINNKLIFTKSGYLLCDEILLKLI